uniref:MARVEL domain-containing protein n=1 Tax=Plectus sambesii TaxID=2011161 RepID=A0A914X372_9BILA
MASSTVQWDANSPQYKCCCHIFHVTMGARILAIVEIVCIGLTLLSDIIRLAAFDGSSVSFTLNVIWVVFFCVVIALLFQAIKTQNALLALPHLIFQIVSIIFYILLLTFAIIALASGSTWAMAAVGLSIDDSFYCPNMAQQEPCNKINGYIDWDSRLAGCVVLIVSFSLLISFELWVFMIVRNLYRYLRDKAEFAPNVASGAPYDGSISRSQSFHIHRIYTIPRRNDAVGPPPEYHAEMQNYPIVNSHAASQLPFLNLPTSPTTTTVEQKEMLSTSVESKDETKKNRSSSVLSSTSVPRKTDSNEQ